MQTPNETPHRNNDTKQNTQKTRTLHVIPSVFQGKGKDGDYLLIPDIPKHKRKDTLWMYTENMHDRYNGKHGGGSAWIRPYAFGNKKHKNGEVKELELQFDEQPLAFGIPVGWTSCSGGFSDFKNDELARLAVDSAFKTLRYLLTKYNINTLYYPANDNNTKLLGVGLFAGTICDENMIYISNKIQSLSNFETLEKNTTSEYMNNIFIQRARQEYMKNKQVHALQEENKELKKTLKTKNQTDFHASSSNASSSNELPSTLKHASSKIKHEVPATTNPSKKPKCESNLNRYIGIGRQYH